MRKESSEDPKDFQRRPAEYAFERLYKADNSTRRFLVAGDTPGQPQEAELVGLTPEWLHRDGPPCGGHAEGTFLGMAHR